VRTRPLDAPRAHVCLIMLATAALVFLGLVPYAPERVAADEPAPGSASATFTLASALAPAPAQVPAPAMPTQRQ
jgi:hypothetical protein